MGNETRGYEYAIYKGHNAEPTELLVGSISEIEAEYDRLKGQGLVPVILGHNKRRKISALYTNYFNGERLEHDSWSVRNAIKPTLLSDSLSDALGVQGGIDPEKIVTILVISNILKADAERLQDSGRVVFSSISVLEDPREEDPVFPVLKGAYEASGRWGNVDFPRFYLSDETLPMPHLLDIMYNALLPYELQDENKKNVYAQGFSGLQKLAVVKATRVEDLQDVYVMAIIKQKYRSLNDLALIYLPTNGVRPPQERRSEEGTLYEELMSNYYKILQGKIVREMGPSFFQEILQMNTEARLAWVRDKLPKD
jgi:hypothetical protein